MIELFARKTAPGWDSWGDEVEGGETVELAKWWHEYQLSNQEQRRQLVQEQQKLHPAPKKKYYRRRKPKAAN